MRYSNFIFLCLLATVLYFVFQVTTSPTSAPATSLSGRPSMRSLSSLSPSKVHLNEVDVEAKKPTNQKDTSKAEENADSNNDAELVYNIDYNGVTTHPTPTPKHP